MRAHFSSSAALTCGSAEYIIVDELRHRQMHATVSRNDDQTIQRRSIARLRRLERSRFDEVEDLGRRVHRISDIRRRGVVPDLCGNFLNMSVVRD